MPRPLPRRDLIRKRRAFGFGGPISGRRHQFMEKGDLTVRIPNPHGHHIDVSLIREILRQAGIDPQEGDQG